MADTKEKFHVPSQEIIPELLLLGALEHRELSLQSGQVIHMDIITYENRQYAIKTVSGGRWFGTLEEINAGLTGRTIELDDVYDEVRFGDVVNIPRRKL